MSINLLPEDIKPQWLSVIRRLQSVAKSEGLSIIQITILVDKEGNPIGWLSPLTRTIEPKGNAAQLLELFTIDK